MPNTDGGGGGGADGDVSVPRGVKCEGGFGGGLGGGGGGVGGVGGGVETCGVGTGGGKGGGKGGVKKKSVGETAATDDVNRARNMGVFVTSRFGS